MNVRRGPGQETPGGSRCGRELRLKKEVRERQQRFPHWNFLKDVIGINNSKEGFAISSLGVGEKRIPFSAIKTYKLRKIEAGILGIVELQE